MIVTTAYKRAIIARNIVECKRKMLSALLELTNINAKLDFFFRFCSLPKRILYGKQRRLLRQPILCVRGIAIAIKLLELFQKPIALETRCFLLLEEIINIV